MRLLELGAHRAHHHLARRMVTIAPYYTNRGELYETIKPLRDQTGRIIGVQVRNARNPDHESAGLDVPLEHLDQAYEPVYPEPAADFATAA
jgi:hypothetical protein